MAVAPSVTTFDLPLMLVVALVALPMALTGRSITQGEGSVLTAF